MSLDTPPANRFHQLRKTLLAESTRPFRARGRALVRCERCLLGQLNCICRWRAEVCMGMDVVIVMHREEVFKPTNTGRLIEDTLPHNSFVFEWSRTRPSPALLHLLDSADRRVVVLYPAGEEGLQVTPEQVSAPGDEKRLTLVVLDGTWRQARRMFHLSPWLNRHPRLQLQDVQPGAYAVRAAPRDQQLATAEAVAAAMAQCGETAAAELLAAYFSVFNQHYLASRDSVAADTGSAAHTLLLSRMLRA